MLEYQWPQLWVVGKNVKNFYEFRVALCAHAKLVQDCPLLVRRQNFAACPLLALEHFESLSVLIVIVTFSLIVVICMNVVTESLDRPEPITTHHLLLKRDDHMLSWDSLRLDWTLAIEEI